MISMERILYIDYIPSVFNNNYHYLLDSHDINGEDIVHTVGYIPSVFDDNYHYLLE